MHARRPVTPRSRPCKGLSERGDRQPGAGRRVPRVHARSRRQRAALPGRPGGATAGDDDLVPARPARAQARQGLRAADRGGEPPQLPRPVRDRLTLPWRRPMVFVAKVELFERGWQGWLLSRLGAFRSAAASRRRAVETSRRACERGGALCIFPEGTRIRRGLAGRCPSRRRQARAGVRGGGAPGRRRSAPSTSAAAGRSDPGKVQLRAGRACTFPRTEKPSPSLAATVTSRIWPNIELQWEWLGGLPRLRKAAVIGSGSWGTAMAILLARGGLDVQLGCRTAESAERIAADRVNDRYLPGVELPEAIRVKRMADIELAGTDLVCSRCPRRGCRPAVGALADRIGGRSGVLVLTKGLVAPIGTLPSAYVADRVPGPRGRLRSAARRMPSEAAPGPRRSCSPARRGPPVPARRRVRPRRAIVRAHRRCVGVEMAGVAKNAAAIAAAAAEPHGLNAAGIATRPVWRECVQYALAQGAREQRSPASPVSGT